MLAVFLYGELCHVLAACFGGEPRLKVIFRNSVRTFFRLWCVHAL
jgi:hypothetical protein